MNTLLWITLFVLLIAFYFSGAGKLNPIKNKFKLSSEVNKEFNLNIWQICTFAIVIYILRALLEGISYKEITILFSGMSIYISVFGLKILNDAKKKINNNSVNLESFISKFEKQNIDTNTALEKVTMLINITFWILLFLLIFSLIMLILSISYPIKWIWILSIIFLFISLIAQSIIILIDKLIIKE